MTQIAVIGTIGRNQKVTKRTWDTRVLDPAVYSEGELNLLLMLERLELQERYYGHKNSTRGIGMITDVLSKGLHTATGIGYFGVLPTELYPVAQAIKTGKFRTQSASRFAGKGNVFSSIGGGFDPNAPVVPLRDCVALFPPPGRGGDLEAWQRALARCEEYNDRIRVLNKYLGYSSHHLIYNFIQDPSILKVDRVAKIQLHRLVVARLADLFGISDTTITNWIVNGIMMHNYEQGGQPLGPNDTINGAREKSREDGHIGDPATLLAILGAIVAALVAIKDIINSVKPQQKQTLIQQAPGLNTKTFGLEYDSDFVGLNEVPPGGNGGNGGDGNNGGGNDNDDNNGGLLSNPTTIFGALMLMVGGYQLINSN